VSNSCQQGVCGSCETAVISGRPDHRDELLSDAERAAGKTMMICCSRSLEPTLTLDL
jgi:vanillate O-demethylase ferredoxin subunit